ncbi:MAG: PQQ-binding-like beta-propeller repeat protein [Planctomycetota bacterium]|nr:PQQ-binding-like beta-propeller repeat protein [Planctomycetota bacterium]
MRNVLVVMFLMTTTMVFAADNWSHFRGDRGDGRADSAQLPLELGEGKNVKWKVPISGKGWSSPVIWENQIWLTTATVDGKKMRALCLDRASGKMIHDILVFENEPDDIRFCHPTNSYASPTAAIEKGTIYVHFGSYGTAALDTATGAKKWERRDLVCNHWRGPASSPVIDQDRVIVSYDGFDVQYVVAFDKETGRTVWKKDRNIDYGSDNGDRKKAYSTATIIEFGGQRQAILPSATATIAYHPKTGTEIWRVRHGGMNAAARPLYGHGLLYITAGDGARAMVAVRPDGTGDITQTHIQWEFSKSVPKRASQLLIDDHLYMMNDAGVATCIEAKTGKMIWQERAGMGEFRSSPIFANGNMYCFSVTGDYVILKCSPEFQKVSDGRFDSGFQASPAVKDNRLYLRSITDLYCIEQN